MVINYHAISLFCRALAMLLIIPAIVCVGLGQYLCLRVSLYNSTECVSSWPITDWDEASLLNGQYFVFAAAIFVFLLLVLLLIGGVCPYKFNKCFVVTLTTVGAAIMLVCFCVEAWYCSGFDLPKIFISQYYQSWIAATIFFGIIMFLFIVDTFAATHYAALKQKTKAASTIYAKSTEIVPHQSSQIYAQSHHASMGGHVNPYYASSAVSHPSQVGYQGKHWGYPMYHY